MYIANAVYIHIPFCQSKCIYCDFPSYPQYFPDYVDEYISALEYEISRSDQKLTECATLFIGGGTPSLLTPRQIECLLKALYKKGWVFDEASMEINPGTINREKLLMMRNLGINRLSFGVQSFDDGLLQLLGRIHTAAQAVENIRMAQQLGFENINLDLMYGLPTQTMSQLQKSLQCAIDLGVSHISAYALKVEQDTRLDELLSRHEIVSVDEELADRMYDAVPEYLAANGLVRYEISNYARLGYECRHNQIYWQYKTYAAFGVAACAFSGKCRATNTFNLMQYLAAYKSRAPIPCEVEHLDTHTRQAEYLFMNLRRSAGFSPQDFQKTFNENINNIYKEVLDKYLRKGLLQVRADGNIALTDLGMRYSNIVFEELL